MLYNGRGMYTTCRAPVMAMILDLPPSDIIVRGYDSHEGVAGILSSITVADCPNPLMSRDIRGSVNHII
jgi:hypothetical protein